MTVTTTTRTTPRIQAANLAGRVLARWLIVQAEIEEMPEAVIGELGKHLLAPGARIPSRRALVVAIRRRRAALEDAAAGAASPLEVELWPTDALAFVPPRALAPMARARLWLLAALGAWKHLNRLDQQAAAAPARMDELRKLKGA
jgi:hypothetical protein